jgi:hypothetical protein
MYFRDRREAGRQLAQHLAAYANRPDVLVLALPRGGVPVAYEVARALHAPLDVFLVRKLGLPGHEEYAMGAVASGGVRVLNPKPAPSSATKLTRWCAPSPRNRPTPSDSGTTTFRRRQTTRCATFWPRPARRCQRNARRKNP